LQDPFIYERSERETLISTGRRGDSLSRDPFGRRQELLRVAGMCAPPEICYKLLKHNDLPHGAAPKWSGSDEVIREV
jgi:hypothetical protein